MEATAGTEIPQNQLQSTKEWMAILMEPALSASRLKVIKPFELNIDMIMSEIKSVTNILRDIGDRIRLPRAARELTEDVDVEEPEDVDKGCDYRLKLPFKMLYQAHVDMLVMHGMYDNCYIQLMKVGEQEELDEVEKKKHEDLEVELQHPDKEPNVVHVKEKKTLSYWEKLQRSKIKQKLRQARLRSKIRSQMNEIKEQVELKAETQRCVIDSNDSDGGGQESSEENQDSHQDSDDAGAVARCMVDNVEDVCPDTKAGKKKKRRGVLRKITAPFRWIKKKL